MKAQIFTHLLYRHWNAYKEGKRTHIFVHLQSRRPQLTAMIADAGTRGHCRPRDLTPGDYDAPVFSLGGQDDYAFSPDGQEICYASNHDKNPAASTNNDLWIVPVTGGAAKTSPPTIPPATRRRSIRPMAATSPTAPSSVRDTRATASASCSTTARRERRKNLTEKFRPLGGNLCLVEGFRSDSILPPRRAGESAVYSVSVEPPLHRSVTVDGDSGVTHHVAARYVPSDGFNDDLGIAP